MANSHEVKKKKKVIRFNFCNALIYICIYITEVFEAPTIFYVSTIFKKKTLKKKNQNKAFRIPDKLFSADAPSSVPQNPINFSSPMLLPQSHGKAHLPSKDTSLLQIGRAHV